MNNNYLEFLEKKKHSIGEFGFEPNYMPKIAFDFQQAIITKAVKKGRIAVFADTGLGKAQPYSEPVLTPNGFIKMGELNVNDLVINSDGKHVKILGIYEQGVKDVYKVTFNDGTFTRCCIDHLWNVRTRNEKKRGYDFKTKPLSEIIKDYSKDIKDSRYPDKLYKDYKYHIPICNKVEFAESENNLPINPYLLGLLIGDGGMTSKSLIITSTKKSILNSVTEYLPKEDYLADSKSINYTIRNKKYSNQPSKTKTELVKLGLFGKLSKEKFIPEIYKYASIENRELLLNGLIDTDGYKVSNDYIEYSTASENLCNDISFLARSLGYVVRVFERDSHYIKDNVKHSGFKNYRVYIIKNGSRKLKTITNIELCDKEECRCILIDCKSHLYITNNFIVTHNTLIELSIAKNIVNHTNKKVLILTPLAVAFQLLLEAEKIFIDDIEYSKDGKHSKKIVICNYERLHYFDSNDFIAVILDESSILKNFDGAIKNKVNTFVKKIQYRFLSTATPSPNDFIELGTSSEALGYMGYVDMLGKFFKQNNNAIDSTNKNIGEKFYLKPHAEKDFFAWVNQWSIMVKMPSDLGFSNEKYILPQLITNKHIVQNESQIDINGQIQMFNIVAKNFNEIRHEQKQTEQQRCIKAVELAQNKTSVYWCNTNNESALLKKMDKEAVEIIGSQSIEKKEEILLAFSKGEIKRIITKAKITSFGLNWQHCNHSVFFPTWSYEQYYQAIRRFWRFGQKNDVNIDIVVSDGQTRVLDALQQKTKKAIELYENLTKNVNSVFVNTKKEFKKEVILPKFIKNE